MASELIKGLSAIDHSFNRGSITNEFYGEGEGSYEKLLNELEREKLSLARDILTHPEFQTLIEDGHITLGAIKPHTEVSKLEVTDDVEGEEKLKAAIQEPLDVIFSLSLSLKEYDVGTFYPEELRDKLNQYHANSGEGTKWDQFLRYMTGGPVTYMVLYDNEGNAVDEWRTQIGATNPSKSDPRSIRGKYAYSIDNNLVHGSANVDDVKHETSWLGEKIGEIIEFTSV